MKKIMFNDRYGLEQAVIARKKTMTHRRIHFPGIDDEDVSNPVMGIDEKGRVYFTFDAITEDVDIYPKYQIGEEVWVAQSYRSLGYKPDEWIENVEGGLQPAQELAGYTNKMFVRSLYLMHRIRITNIKVERLQDITEQECICEGIKIKKGNRNGERPFGEFTFDGWDDYSFTAREAFAALIDRISGRGTWQSNPWVYAYTFELVY